jgi:hypothetical protein
VAWCAPSARGVPVLSMAGCSARPCCGWQAGEDMIVVQLTCELLCAIPVREVSVADPTRAPGLQRRTVRDRRERGLPRGGSGYRPARSRDRRRPDDLGSRSRRGCQMSRLRRRGQVPVRDRMARCGKLHRHSLSLSVTLSMDETSRQAFWPSSGSGMTGLLEAP